MNRKSILVIEEDEGLRLATQKSLQKAGYEVIAAAEVTTGLDAVDAPGPALVLAGVKAAGPSGADLIRELHTRCPETTIVLIAPAGAAQTGADDALKAGAYDYITAPIDNEELLVVLERALERRDLLDPVLNLRAAIDLNPGFESIIGRSKSLLRTLNMALRAARTDSVVLVSGETGTGKELLAKAIHQSSRRKDGPFAIINCGAIPRDLLESELFGHTRGAFTGAVADKRGRAEMAGGGTLFLDEIGELPVELQVKLLRLVQQGEIEKVGATGTTRLDVRIVAATHRNLRAMVDSGAFREDLYYRLAVIPLELPPLRARAEDIPQLAQHIFERLRDKHGRRGLRLPASLMPYLAGYSWPGNVRELENVIERLVVLTAANEITRDDLPEYLQRKPASAEGLRLDMPSERLSLESMEKEIIFRALKKFSWNQTHAAQYLDISRRTLIYRMEKYGLKADRGRTPGDAS
jgi:DNA-binding NtrC family response regulator